MANLPEIRKNRIEKLKKLLHAGLNPYPAKSRRTHQIAEVLKNFSKLEKKAEEVVILSLIHI